MHTAKRPAIRRLLIIDRALRSGSFPTVDELARDADVNSKTIYRDLHYLRLHYEAPVEYCGKRRGWHYSVPTYYLPAVIITRGELLAFFLAEQVLRQHPGLPFERDVKSAIRKLSELLPDEISIDADAVRQAHSFRNSVTSYQNADHMSTLGEAILQRRRLEIAYWTASRDAETTRTIDPWHMTCVDGAWYIVAWCHLRKALRVFSPLRIRSIKPTSEEFTIPSDFDVDHIFRGSFKVVCDDGQPLQTVRLRFVPSAAKYVKERVYHASQVLDLEEDGSVILQIELRSLIEVRRWILSWGAECEALSPPELVDSIDREVSAMMKRTRRTQRIPSVSSPRSKSKKRLPQKG